MVADACAELVFWPGTMSDAQTQSLRDIFDEHGRFVWRALRYLGVREADLDDVCQEVFVVVHRKLADFEGRSSLRTWIYGICVRAAADHRKGARRRRESPVANVPELACPPNQLAELERASARDLVRTLLDGLDDEKRAVVVLYDVEGLTMREVAEAVGCPLQTAYWRLHAAHKELAAAARRIRARGAA
jgi:RNA polymerase sigma-70 factor, ECF subfamily